MQTLTLKHGDCVQRMAEMPDGSVDAVVCDPPYGLKFMQTKERTWDDLGEGASQREWHKAWLEQAYRVLKPNGLIMAFNGTRTHHHLSMAMQSAGFTDLSVRVWAYGSGFPKSLNVQKFLDKQAGKQGEVIGTKRGVGGENMNDIVRGGAVRTTDDEGGKGVGAYGTGAKQVPVTLEVRAPATEESARWAGFGSALKPAWEPVVVARKPC